MLKFNLSSDEFDSMEESQQSMYSSSDDGYVLDVEGIPEPKEIDVTALKSAKVHEVDRRKKAEAKLRKYESDAKTKENDDLKNSGKFEDLEKSFKNEKATLIEGYEGTIGKHKSFIQTALVDNVAMNLAVKLNPKKPKVLLPHIKARLQADFDGDTPQTRVVDAEGLVSTMTIDELEKDFIANDDFSDIITINNASGGGATGGKVSKGSAVKNKMSDYNSLEQVQLARENPAEYERLAGKEKTIF
ncbi:hypothetical protein COB55_03250 [Candidatus Wolfebacteria bacterium]|nr:MAG: hypothetical protein COB55_03250 [Candidatus Wolfebacteria bacterium]